MRQRKKICPDCGLPYMPWSRALFMMVVVFCGGFIVMTTTGGAAWVIFHHHRAVGLALPPGLLLGAIFSYWGFRRRFSADKGWNYCSCISSM